MSAGANSPTRPLHRQGVNLGVTLGPDLLLSMHVHRTPSSILCTLSSARMLPGQSGGLLYPTTYAYPTPAMIDTSRSGVCRPLVAFPCPHLAGPGRLSPPLEPGCKVGGLYESLVERNAVVLPREAGRQLLMQCRL